MAHGAQQPLLMLFQENTQDWLVPAVALIQKWATMYQVVHCINSSFGSIGLVRQFVSWWGDLREGERWVTGNELRILQDGGRCMVLGRGQGGVGGVALLSCAGDIWGLILSPQYYIQADEHDNSALKKEFASIWWIIASLRKSRSRVKSLITLLCF